MRIVIECVSHIFISSNSLGGIEIRKLRHVLCSSVIWVCELMSCDTIPKCSFEQVSHYYLNIIIVKFKWVICMEHWIDWIKQVHTGHVFQNWHTSFCTLKCIWVILSFISRRKRMQKYIYHTMAYIYIVSSIDVCHDTLNCSFRSKFLIFVVLM